MVLSLFNFIAESCCPRQAILNKYRGHVAIFSIKMDGRGDVVAGSRIREIVKEILPRAETTFSVIEVDISSKHFSEEGLKRWSERTFIPLKDIIKSTNWQITDASKSLSELQKFTCNILVFADYECFIPDPLKECSAPVIRINEFEKRRSTAQTLECLYGFDEDCVGITFSKELNDFYQKHKHESRFERLTHLSKLEEPLLSCILGAPYSHKALETFQRENSLYYGYGLRENFMGIFACVLLAVSSTKNVTVCFLNKGMDIQNSLGCDVLRQLGCSKYVLHHIDDKGTYNKATHCIPQAQGDRTLTVIMTALNQSQARTLLWASEDEVLICGQESFQEACMFRKHIANDLRPSRVHLMQTFVARAKVQNKLLGQHLEKAYFSGTESQDFVNPESMFYGLCDLFASLKNPRFKNQYLAFIDRLYKKHNFKDKLEKIFVNLIQQEKKRALKTKANQSSILKRLSSCICAATRRLFSSCC